MDSGQEPRDPKPQVKPETVPSGLTASPRSPTTPFGRKMANGEINPYDKKWQRNFSLLKTIIRPDGSLEYSALSMDGERRMKNFVKDQRKYFRQRENNEESPLTDERYKLLAGTNFSFVPVRGTGFAMGLARSRGLKNILHPEAIERKVEADRLKKILRPYSASTRLMISRKAEEDRIAAKAEEIVSNSEIDGSGGSPGGDKKMETEKDRLAAEEIVSNSEIDGPGGSPDGEKKMGGLDRAWHEKFDRLKPLIQPDGSVDYSSLAAEAQMPMKRFVYGQRKQFQQREKNEKTALTDERHGLLSEAGFSFVRVKASKGRKPKESNSTKTEAAAELGAVDRKWHESLERLKPLISPDGSVDYSSLDAEARMPMQRFVERQRKSFRQRENNQKSSLTDERYRLLSERNFSFAPVEIWQAKFERLKPIIRPDGSVDYSALDAEARVPMQRFVGGLRKSFRQRVNNEKTSLTDERYRLLDEAGFSFVPVLGKASKVQKPPATKTKAVAETEDETSTSKEEKRSRKRKANKAEPNAVKTEEEAGDAPGSAPGNDLGRVENESQVLADGGGMPNDNTNDNKDINTTVGSPGDKKVGAIDRRWHDSFDRLKAIMKPDGSLEYSALDEKDRKYMKSFVKDQRKYFRKRENNEKSPMTDERYNLLAEANFQFDARGGRPPRTSARPRVTTVKEAETESELEDKMSAILEGADERFPLFDEETEYKKRKSCKPEPDVESSAAEADDASESMLGAQCKRHKTCKLEPDESSAEESGDTSEGADRRCPLFDETGCEKKLESRKPEPNDEETGDALESMLGTECKKRKSGKPEPIPAKEAGDSESFLGNASGRVENGSQVLADGRTPDEDANDGERVPSPTIDDTNPFQGGEENVEESAKDDRCCLM